MPEHSQDISSTNKVQSVNLPALLPSTSVVLKRTQTAVGLLRDMVQESSADYWYEQGIKANKAQEWIEAEYALNKCISIEPAHWRGSLQLTVSLASQKQVTNAASQLIKAYFGLYIDFQLLFSNELSQIQWEILQHKFDECNQVVPGSSNVLLALIIILSVREEWKEARKALESTKFQDNADSALWHRLSGMVWYYQQDYAKAIIDFDYSIELNQQSHWAYIERGRAKMEYVNTGDLETLSEDIEYRSDAWYDFERAIELESKSVAAYMHRASVSADREHYDESLSDSNIAVDLAPKYYALYKSRGQLKRLTKDYDGAIADLDYAIELAPNEADNYFWRGVAKFDALDFFEAGMDMGRCIKLDPNHASAYLYRAQAKDKLGFRASAQTDRQVSRTLRGH